jgi:amino acid permease
MELSPDHKDAGALFVLESKGTWMHAGYHLTTAIAGPSLLTLPYAIHFLGWFPGLLALTIGGAVSSYAYCLLSRVLEHFASQGERCLRFRDLSQVVIGRTWTVWFVIPVQFGVCFVTLIGVILTGGYGCKLIYQGLVPNGPIQLWVFVAAFGAVMMILAQLPSFHSLRYISLVSLVLCLTYSACAVAGSILAGFNPDVPPKHYSVEGSPIHKMFGVFTALSIMAGVYGVALVPEIQATLAPPVKGKMEKGIALCYTVVFITFYPVAISGYWAFGNKAQGNIFDNLVPDVGPSLMPQWLVGIASIAIVAQLLAIGLVYVQPIYEVLESKTADISQSRYSLRNVAPRLVLRSLYLAVATVLGAMLPFFGDIVSLIGAFGYTPLDFVLPMLFYQLVFRPSPRSLVFWLNWCIIVVFSIVGVIGCVASFRSIVMNANTYHLFANV